MHLYFVVQLLRYKRPFPILICVFSTLYQLTLTPKTHVVRFHLKLLFFFWSFFINLIFSPEVKYVYDLSIIKLADSDRLNSVTDKLPATYQ